MSLSDNINIAADAPAPTMGAKVPLGAKLECGPLTPFFEKVAMEFPTIVSKCENETFWICSISLLTSEFSLLHPSILNSHFSLNSILDYHQYFSNLPQSSVLNFHCIAGSLGQWRWCCYSRSCISF
jgi:hypothetical protein